MRTLLRFLMLALLTVAPLAAAQEETKPDESPERPDDAAWVEDCPPDMMCAASEPQAYGDEDCIACSGPADQGGAEPGQALGPEDCIECMRPPADEGTCMDGAEPEENCRAGRDCASASSGGACGDDVQDLGGPTRGPADGSCENCRGEEAEPISARVPETQSAARSNVPAPTVAVAILALAAMAILVLPRRE